MYVPFINSQSNFWEAMLNIKSSKKHALRYNRCINFINFNVQVVTSMFTLLENVVSHKKKIQSSWNEKLNCLSKRILSFDKSLFFFL